MHLKKLKIEIVSQVRKPFKFGYLWLGKYVHHTYILYTVIVFYQ
jgi:hypothetical protein